MTCGILSYVTVIVHNCKKSKMRQVVRIRQSTLLLRSSQRIRSTNDSVQHRELKTMRRQKCHQFRNNFHKRFQVHHQKRGRLATRSLGCESSKRYDSIKLEGVQLQDERATLEVWDLHDQDVASMSNLQMTLEAVLHSLVQLIACKMWPYATP